MMMGWPDHHSKSTLFLIFVRQAIGKKFGDEFFAEGLNALGCLKHFGGDFHVESSALPTRRCRRSGCFVFCEGHNPSCAVVKDVKFLYFLPDIVT